MTRKIEGIIPVMLTPFTDEGQIDYPGLERGSSTMDVHVEIW
jgi:4-hydroxy-tetrahydrodipicolinate synthase